MEGREPTKSSGSTDIVMTEEVTNCQAEEGIRRSENQPHTVNAIYEVQILYICDMVRYGYMDTQLTENLGYRDSLKIQVRLNCGWGTSTI